MPTPPEDPGFFDKVNYVIDSWARPCRAPWYIYIETMGPAALEAFITLITFGWDDVARGYFRPRGLYKRRTGKRKGKWAKRLPRFPELGEEIGKRLPGADRVKGKKWSELGKTLWRIDSVLQRGLFWWLVVDVTNDFAFNWTSTLYETEWCKESDKGGFSAQTAGEKILPGFAWWNVNAPIFDYNIPPVTWNGNRCLVPPEGASVSAGINFKRWPSQPPPTGTQVRITDRITRQVLAKSGLAVSSGSGDSQNVVFGNITGPREIIVEMWVDVPFAIYFDGIVTGQEQ